MSDVSDYLEARAAYVACDKQLDGMYRVLGLVQDGLSPERRGRFSFINGPTAGLPSEAILDRGISKIDVGEFPTIDSISAALGRWHQTRDAMMKAWQVVPDQHKDGLQPPPGQHRSRSLR